MKDITHKTEVSGSSPEWPTTLAKTKNPHPFPSTFSDGIDTVPCIVKQNSIQRDLSQTVSSKKPDCVVFPEQNFSLFPLSSGKPVSTIPPFCYLRAWELLVNTASTSLG